MSVEDLLSRCINRQEYKIQIYFNDLEEDVYSVLNGSPDYVYNEISDIPLSYKRLNVEAWESVEIYDVKVLRIVC